MYFFKQFPLLERSKTKTLKKLKMAKLQRIKEEFMSFFVI